MSTKFTWVKCPTCNTQTAHILDEGSATAMSPYYICQECAIPRQLKPSEMIAGGMRKPQPQAPSNLQQLIQDQLNNRNT